MHTFGSAGSVGGLGYITPQREYVSSTPTVPSEMASAFGGAIPDPSPAAPDAEQVA